MERAHKYTAYQAYASTLEIKGVLYYGLFGGGIVWGHAQQHGDVHVVSSLGVSLLEHITNNIYCQGVRVTSIQTKMQEGHLSRFNHALTAVTGTPTHNAYNFIIVGLREGKGNVLGHISH